jgi:hypothetical protein
VPCRRANRPNAEYAPSSAVAGEQAIRLDEPACERVQQSESDARIRVEERVEVVTADRETLDVGCCAYTGHVDGIVDQKREFSEAFSGEAVERLGAKLDRGPPGRQDQQTAAGLILLEEYLARSGVKVTRMGGETLERVIGKRGEHWDAPELGDLVLVNHPRNI